MRTEDDRGLKALSPGDIPLPFAELDPDGRLHACNHALLELTGYQDIEAVPPLIDLIPPEWQPEKAKAGQDTGPRQTTADLPVKGGGRIQVEAFVSRVDDAEGRPCRFLACVIDAATFSSVEMGMIRAEQRISIASGVLDTIQSPIFATDEGSIITFANAHALRLFGNKGSRAIGMNLWDAYPISHYDLFYRIYHRALHEHRILSADHYEQRLNLWYEAHFYPAAGGGMVVVMNNVTARKHYEQFIGLAAFTVNKLSDYVFWLDEKGLIVKANDAATRDLRFPEKRKARFSISEVSAIGLEAWRGIWKEIKSKGTTMFDTSLIRQDGSAIPVETSVSFVLYVGREYGILIARDASSRIKADQEIAMAKEQAELYLDLMSHDIRNMNQVGIGYLEMALDSPGIGEEAKALLEKPLEAFNHSSELIANVKKLQKTTGMLTLEKVDLADMLRETVSQYSGVQGREVSIRLQAEEGCYVKANPLLKEVFSNLVGNAIKHSEGKIDIWITLRKVIVADRPCCEVYVEDNGPGIADDIKAMLFSTRKLPERGGRYRGLGLILAKSLVDDFNGVIKVEDRVPGDYRQGARFIVTLPSA